MSDLLFEVILFQVQFSKIIRARNNWLPVPSVNPLV